MGLSYTFIFGVIYLVGAIITSYLDIEIYDDPSEDEVWVNSFGTSLMWPVFIVWLICGYVLSAASAIGKRV